MVSHNHKIIDTILKFPKTSFISLDGDIFMWQFSKMFFVVLAFLSGKKSLCKGNRGYKDFVSIRHFVHFSKTKHILLSNKGFYFFSCQIKSALFGGDTSFVDCEFQCVKKKLLSCKRKRRFK